MWGVTDCHPYYILYVTAGTTPDNLSGGYDTCVSPTPDTAVRGG